MPRVSISSDDDLYTRRINWLCRQLETSDFSYGEAFSKKILANFGHTGIIPLIKRKYYCVPVDHYSSSKEVRKFLKKLGIKSRGYFCDGNIEFLLKEEDYNLFRMSVNLTMIELYDESTHINLNELYLNYEKDFLFKDITLH